MSRETFQSLRMLLMEKLDLARELTDEEILDLLVNRKWYATIFEGIKALYVTTSHQMTNRIVELVERYEDTLPELTAAVAEYEAKIKDHLKRMGFEW